MKTFSLFLDVWKRKKRMTYNRGKSILKTIKTLHKMDLIFAPETENPSILEFPCSFHSKL